MNYESEPSLTAPAVVRTKELTAAITRRADDVVRTVGERRYRSELAAWSRDELDTFPVREEIEAEIREELVVLCQALGAWATVEPARLWPPPHPS
jgi:hypothetical protein